MREGSRDATAYRTHLERISLIRQCCLERDGGEAVGAAEVGLGGVVFPRITDEGGGGDLRTGEEGLCAFGDSRGVVELVIGTGELKLVDVATDELLIEGHHYLTVLVLSADGLGRERYLLAEAAAVEGT